METIKVLVFDKGYKAQGFFLDCNGLFEMNSVEELIKLFLDNMEGFISKTKMDYKDYRNRCLNSKEINQYNLSVYQTREKEFYSIKDSKIIETEFANFEFRIKII